MNIKDAFNASEIALFHEEKASNRIPYLGEGLFPPQKKMGLDLSWIKTATGLPVSLAPSEFDAKSSLRSREGFDVEKTEMAFFRESMLISEHDEQEIMRVQDKNDPYAMTVLTNIFDDANRLIEGARVVPERMVWQLLASETGEPKIYISANNAVYEYDYDPDNDFVTNNYKALSGAAMWSQTETADPITDVMEAQDAVEAATGNRPSILVISKETMGWLKKNKNLKSYILAQNATANVYMTDARVKELFASELGVNVVVYTKQYKNESGAAAKFYPDNVATLLPNEPLGSMWYGTTPEERTLIGSPTADVSLVDTGIAVAVTILDDPVNTKTTVSEIVLPSFERMKEVYIIKTNTDYLRTFTMTNAEGSASGTTKFTLSPSSAAGTNTAYYYKVMDAPTLPPYGAELDGTWTAYTSGANITTTAGKYVVIAEAKTATKVVESANSGAVASVKA